MVFLVEFLAFGVQLHTRSGIKDECAEFTALYFPQAPQGTVLLWKTAPAMS